MGGLRHIRQRTKHDVILTAVSLLSSSWVNWVETLECVVELTLIPTYQSIQVFFEHISTCGTCMTSNIGPTKCRGSDFRISLFNHHGSVSLMCRIEVSG